jgi:hypothetical protein
MASTLQATSLILEIARLSTTFKGTPQQLVDEILSRARIVSPTGTGFIFTGDTEPTSNVGPWLRGGTKWYVWDDATKRYKPLDISDSETKWFHVGASTPATSDPPVWLRTTHDQTEADPSIGDPLGWYVFNGTGWVPISGIPRSGGTASRPTSPIEFQQFYDSDISCLLWWERGAWRTVSGVPGDIKFVGQTTLSAALTQNPGWALFGASNSALRGRYFVMAAKDSAGTDLTVSPNVAKRQPYETFGETDGVKIDGTSPVPYPPSIGMFALIKE